MLESDSTIFLIAACGLLFLRPGDVPLLARYAGRLVGGSVRGLRGLRDTADAALAEGESVLGKQGGAVGQVREDLRASLSKFDSLRNTVTRDVARFSPFDKLNGGFRGALQPQRVQPTVKRRAEGGDAKEGERTGVTPRNMRSLTSVDRAQSDGQQPATGVDFIARSIEEAALAQQQQRIFGRPVDNENESTSASRPDPLDPPSRG